MGLLLSWLLLVGGAVVTGVGVVDTTLVDNASVETALVWKA